MFSSKRKISHTRQALAKPFSAVVLSVLLMASNFTFASTVASPNVLAGTNSARDRIGEIDQWLSKKFPPEQPGAIIIISQNGKPLLKKAYGLSDLENKKALAFTDVMRIASITKPFTAMAIMLLEEDGKLSLQDDIRKHLPSQPANGQVITIAHLLTHTSGLGVYTEATGFREIVRDDMTQADVLNFIAKLPPSAAPGSVTNYNNSGFYILGAIIEKASGMAYADFLKTRIFAPLQMTNTALEGAPQAPKIIPNYRAQDGKFSAAPKVVPVMAFSAGSILSTADDMARWLSAVENRKLLKPATWARVLTKATLANGALTEYGYGWRLRKLRGQDLIEHGGNINGFQSQVMLLPKEQLSFIVMINQQTRHNTSRNVTEHIAATMLGKPFQAFNEAKLSDEALEKFAGNYVAKDASARKITRVGQQLRVEFNATQSLFSAYGDAAFFQPDVSFTRYHFVKNAAGDFTELVRIDAGDEEQIFYKVAP